MPLPGGPWVLPPGSLHPEPGTGLPCSVQRVSPSPWPAGAPPPRSPVPQLGPHPEAEPRPLRPPRSWDICSVRQGPRGSAGVSACGAARGRKAPFPTAAPLFAGRGATGPACGCRSLLGPRGASLGLPSERGGLRPTRRPLRVPCASRSRSGSPSGSGWKGSPSHKHTVMRVWLIPAVATWLHGVSAVHLGRHAHRLLFAWALRLVGRVWGKSLPSLSLSFFACTVGTSLSV